MPQKNPESAHVIKEHDGRLVSGSTHWWVQKAPKAYTYYCIHGIKLTDECDKCVRRVMKFSKAA